MGLESKIQQTAPPAQPSTNAAQLSLAERTAAVAPKLSPAETKTIGAQPEKTSTYLRNAIVDYAPAKTKKMPAKNKLRVHGDIFSKPEYTTYDPKAHEAPPAVVYDTNKGHIEKQFMHRVSHLAPAPAFGLTNAPASTRLTTIRMNAMEDSGYLWN